MPRLCLFCFIAIFFTAMPVPAADAPVSPEAKVQAPVKDAGQESEEKKEGRRGLKEMSTDEIVEHIGMILDRGDEVMDFIPGLKLEKDPSGVEYYTYNGVRLEKLEKDKLIALNNKIQQEKTRLNAERINKQLESIRQAQQASNAARIQAISRPPQPPPSPPRVQQSQPTPPRAPVVPPSVRR
jgi:hypothetical protein